MNTKDAFSAIESGKRNLWDVLDEVETLLICMALRRAGNTRKAAALLGLNRTTLVAKKKRLRI
jgi:DNA-binding protein Fis